MRIAVFAKGTTFHPSFGGLETQNKTLCTGFADSGHDVTVFSPQKDFTGELVFKDSGVNYVLVPCIFKMGKFFGFFGFWDKNNWVNRSYEEFCKLDSEKNFDLVITQSSAGVGIIKRKEAHSFKSLMIAHGTIMSEYRTYILELKNLSLKKLLKLAPNTGYAIKNFFTRQRECVLGVGKIAAVSTYVKQALIDETFAPDEKFIVIHNGIVIPDQPEVFTKDTQTLFFAGRLEYSKGVHILLKAFNLILEKHPTAKLVIAGSGPEEQNLQRIAKELGVETSVTFLGWLSKEMVEKELQKATIFAFPTLRLEGFPMSIVEALSFGLPAVVSDIGGNSDAVIHGKTGFLTKPGDYKSFADSVLKLLDNDTMLKEMSLAAIESCKTDFSQEVMLTNYLKLISHL